MDYLELFCYILTNKQNYTAHTIFALCLQCLCKSASLLAGSPFPHQYTPPAPGTGCRAPAANAANNGFMQKTAQCLCVNICVTQILAKTKVGE